MSFTAKLLRNITESSLISDRWVITSPEIQDTRMTLPRRWLDNGLEVKP